MDAHAATAGLKAVHDEVVGAGTHLERVLVEQVQLVDVRQGEGLVLGLVALTLLIPMEQREVHDPEELVALARNVERVGHVRTHTAEDAVGLQAGTGGEHDEVTGLDVAATTQLGHLLVGEELHDRAVHGAVLTEGDPGEALGAEGCGDLGELVDLSAGPSAGALGVDGLDHVALGSRSACEHLERGVGEHVGQVDELHAVTGVGLIGAVGVHGVPVGQATQRRGHLHAHTGEGVGQHVLELSHDVVLLDKAHLDVDLGELGLAVGAQILVTEALGNLVVALDAADHEKLLEQLRGLRQGVEAAGLQAARHHEVTRTFRRGLEQGRRLDLGKGAVVQRGANSKGEIGAQAKASGHLGTAKVQVAIAQARILGGLDAVLDLERRGLGTVEHGGVVDEDLDLAGCEPGVHRVVTAVAHDTVNANGPLGTHGLGDLESIAIGVLGVEVDLRDALTVAQVAEDQAAMIAAAAHPTGEGDLLADVGGAKLAAGVGVHAVHVGGVGGRRLGHKPSS